MANDVQLPTTVYLPTKCDQIVQLIYLAPLNRENYKHMSATGLAREPQKFRSSMHLRDQILILFINPSIFIFFSNISDLLVTT